MSTGRRLQRWRVTLRWTWRLVLLAALIDAGYLVHLWPDWQVLAEGPIPESRFTRHYVAARRAAPSLPPLRWRPVPLNRIPDSMVRAVVDRNPARQERP